VIEPIDPRERRELDGVDAAPGTSSSDDLRLEKADDRLGQGVVVGVADAADRALDAGGSEALGVADRQVLLEFKWPTKRCAGPPKSTRKSGAGSRNSAQPPSETRSGNGSIANVTTGLAGRLRATQERGGGPKSGHRHRPIAVRDGAAASRNLETHGHVPHVLRLRRPAPR
jgi:hypothetical protein